jgi:hypothetical protein
MWSVMEGVVLKLFEGSHRIQSGNHVVPGALQDGLASRGLDRIVVDQ